MSNRGDAIWGALELSGANDLIRRRRSRLLVVCYHGICHDACTESHWLLVRRGTFARQLDYVRARFRILPLDVAVERLVAGELVEPTAAITFDDGYRNNLQVAWPELRAREIPCTIFLPTGLISAGGTLWTTTLEYTIRQSKAAELDLRGAGGPRLALESAAGRADAAHTVKEWLKGIDQTRRREVAESVMAGLGGPAAPPAEFALMSWSEVRELADTGMVRFGAHTVGHEIVSQLGDRDVEREISESVGAVSALGAAASRVFAYPNGRFQDFDDRALAILRELDLLGAVTTVPGLNERSTPRYQLRRLVVDERMRDGRFAAEAGGVAALWAEATAGSRRP